jgi:hypothetical protein
LAMAARAACALSRALTVEANRMVPLTGKSALAANARNGALKVYISHFGLSGQSGLRRVI